MEVRGLQGQSKGQCCTFSVLIAFSPNSTAMGFDNALRNEQSKTCACLRFGCELCKKPWHDFRINACARVLNRYYELSIFILCGNVNRSLFCKLDSIV